MGGLLDGSSTIETFVDIWLEEHADGRDDGVSHDSTPLLTDSFWSSVPTGQMSM